jgi:hypothetical protein
MNLHTTNTPSKQKAILFNKDLTTIVIEWFMKHKDAMQMHLKTKTDIDEFRKVLGMTSNEIPETVSFAQAWLDLAPEFQEFSNIRFATVEGMHRHISIMLGMTSSSFDVTKPEPRIIPMSLRHKDYVKHNVFQANNLNFDQLPKVNVIKSNEIAKQDSSGMYSKPLMVKIRTCKIPVTSNSTMALVLHALKKRSYDYYHEKHTSSSKNITAIMAEILHRFRECMVPGRSNIPAKPRHKFIGNNQKTNISSDSDILKNRTFQKYIDDPSFDNLKTVIDELQEKPSNPQSKKEPSLPYNIQMANMFKTKLLSPDKAVEDDELTNTVVGYSFYDAFELNNFLLWPFLYVTIYKHYNDTDSFPEAAKQRLRFALDYLNRTATLKYPTIQMAREYDMGDEFSHIYSDNFLDLQALMFFGWLANYGITITKEDKNKDNKNFDRIITALEKAEQSFENKDHKTILKTIGKLRSSA